MDSVHSIPPETLKAALELWGQAGEMHYLPVRGSSMLPLLRNGDQVLVAHQPDRVRVGDVVIFQRPDGLVAHRVLRVSAGNQGRSLRTKGDRVPWLDTELSEPELVGRVLAIRRNGRLMRVDTAVWKVSGRALASVMWLQAWVYHQAGSSDSELTARVMMNISQILLKLSLVLVGTCQVILGRWQQESDLITG